MKALIGLDRFTDNRPVLDLFARMGFADCRVTLAHSMPPQRPAAFVPIPTLAGGFEPAMNAPESKQVSQTIKLEAEKLLERDRHILYEAGIHCETALLLGSPGEELIRKATEMNADLVCVTATIRGGLKAAVLGSVCRTLTIGSRKSILIAKHRTKHNKPLTAVLATDQSAYCNKAIENLLKLNPMGMQKLIVLTAAPNEQYDFDEFALDPSELLTECEKIALKFQKLSMETECVVLEEPIVEAINQTMKAHHADLLIVAAQGHGFVERLLIGSTSLHEAVAENHSLLIMRN